ncbi:MAG: hypothetical protein D4S02_13695 [Rhodocyclaceae bacterium]|nr:MAG: hypothetical protein D4S02_13695 [Rhodocyclaceae bacterium]
MSAKIERWLIALFVLGSLAVFLWINQTRPRVLILHSYGTDYTWVRDVNIGLKRVLDGKPFFAIRWHYMDLKRYPWPEYKKSAGLRARRAIEDFAPDVVIAIDDDAQKYAAMHYVGHPRIKIVFAGINGSIEPYGYDKASNVAGILERKQLSAVRLAINDAGIKGPGGQPPRILLIGDTSESVKSDMENIALFDWKPMTIAGKKLAQTFDDWQNIINSAEGQADIIITTNYRKLTRSKDSKELVQPDEIVRWTEKHSKVPLIGTNGFYVEDGGMMAIGTSGYEQGEEAAKMAIRIIDSGISPGSIPVVMNAQFVVYLRPALLQYHKITLPPLYEAFARATNSYME